MGRVTFFKLDQSAAGTTTVAPASPGNRHKVLGFMFSPPSSGTRGFKFAGSVSGDLTGVITIQSGGLPSWQGPHFFCESGLNEELRLVTSGAAFKGIISYLTEP